MTRIVKVGKIRIGGHNPLVMITGPCVIEGRKETTALAGKLVRMARREHVPLIFKASYDKANRSSLSSYRGPGLVKGLGILAEIREKYDVPILTDVHCPADVGIVAAVADVIQIPAFLCRQTDLIIAAAESGKVVNVKKGQFLAPWDVQNIVAKIESTGNRNILLTERGVSFGYNNLVADMRSLLVMRQIGYPVVFDATHSVQKPGGAGNRSAGDGKWAPALARAAVATGCDAVFMETHEEPAKALSDSDNAVALGDLAEVWRMLRKINAIVE